MTLRSCRRPCTLAVVAWLAAAAAVCAEDLLIRRDGGRETGRLAACVSDRCQWQGRLVPRAEIAWIGLGDGGTPPPPEDPASDEVRLRDGRVLAGPIAGISLGVVSVAGESIERSAVSWVYFGSSGGGPVPERAAPDPVSPPPAAAPPVPPEPAAGSTPAPPVAEAALPRVAPAPARLLLNEVRFLPPEGEPAFIELLNPTPEALALAGLSLRNDKGQTVELPADLDLAPGAVLLVLFDGGKGAADGVVHAPLRNFLDPASGMLRLSDEKGLADGVAWGEGRLGAVDLCRGGRCALPAPGSVLARLPGSTAALTPAAWAPLEPDGATPGRPNPRPPVSAFAGLPGMVFRGAPRLSWYSVPGAALYRVQIAPDAAFATVLEEATVSGSGVERRAQLFFTARELPPGDYVWRVQALGAGGEAAEFSRPVAFSVEPPRTGSPSRSGGALAGRAQGRGDDPVVPPPAQPSSEVRKELAVPVLAHRKDTRMLTLEAPSEEPPWSWDTPDSAGYPYCARAGVAMLNGFHGGKLSQDRIGYEAFKDLREGPEFDLPVVGMADWRTSRFTLPLAIGTAGEYRSNTFRGHPSGPGDHEACLDYVHDRVLEECVGRGWAADSPECRQHRYERETEVPCPTEVAYAWGFEALRAIRQEIDAGRPLIATTPSHLFLIVGYVQEGDRFSIVYQDEGGRQDVRVNASGLMTFLDSYWTGLAPVKVASDEPSIATDSDGDGLVDFDETERFATDPRKADTDGDGISDKNEVRYSVWDPDGGYHRSVEGLAATASDQTVAAAVGRAALRDPMELMPDSDSGGCKDGEEDLNADGKRTPDETSNFRRGDDPATDEGCGLWTGTSQTRFWSRGADSWLEVLITARMRLREVGFSPLIDPGPERGGRRAGAPIGSQVQLRCDGTTVEATWRQQYWGSSWTCSCSGAGSRTVADEGEKRFSAGFLYRKTVDWDLTPVLGFDIPRGGGLYGLGCSAHDPTFTVSCMCTDGGSSSGPAAFPYPGGISRGLPSSPVACNHDPEVRYLEDSSRMVGSYSVTNYDCAPNGADMTWSLCKAGTPCAPLPPLPGASPAGESR
jgi:hypothetical protein